MTDRTPAIAVIIICYNGEEYVTQAVTTVLRQTLTDFELVVVEDGSHGGTESVVSAFNDPRVRYVWRPNGGTSAARNTGAAATTAPLIAFLDCDDWWDPRKLEAQVEALRASPEAGVVYSAAMMVTEGTGRTAIDPALIVGDVLPRLLMRNCVSGSASSVMVRRDVFERIGGFDESMKYAEDWDCWLRLAQVTQFVRVERPDVFINVRPGSLGRQTENLRLAAHGLVNRAFHTAGPQYRPLKRVAHADVEFGASVDLAHHGKRRMALVPLLRAIRYDPLRAKFWKRLTLLVISKFVPSQRYRTITAK